MLYNLDYHYDTKTRQGNIANMLAVLRRYYHLTKPGIIYGNLLTTIGGFMLASRGSIDWWLLLATALGTGLIIASACVFNNYIDQDIDAKMKRTQRRAMVIGDISEEAAWFFGSTLGLIGVGVLAKFTNSLVLLLGIIGFVSYVFVYTYAKRKTVHATLLGTIPGATPIAAGYVAVTGRIDLGAVLVFTIMILWQLPHFYAIAMFRRDEYAAAGVPVMSVVHGMRTTKQWIVVCTVLFAAAAAALALYGYASFSYFVVMLLLSAWWLWQGVRGLRLRESSEASDELDKRWARKMFGLSLIILLAFSITLVLDAWLL